MFLHQKIIELEKRLEKLESFIPEWVSLSKSLSKEYGYTIDGFRNYCLTNIIPTKFKKIDNKYYIHKSMLKQRKVKKVEIYG